MSEIIAADDAIAPVSEPKISIDADLAAKFTFASHQNSISVIRAISIRNPTANAAERLRLELTASPAFLRPKTWTIDRLLADDDITLTDRRIDLDPAYLSGLDEAESGRTSRRSTRTCRELQEGPDLRER